MRNRLEFLHGDAFEILESSVEDDGSVYFIDPPYTAGGKQAGKRLYKHFDLDHEALFSLCSQLRGDFIMTYDNAEEVKALALKYGFQAKPIAMRNTHHAKMTELVIGRNLEWMKGIGRVLEKQAAYPEKKKLIKK